MNDFSKPQPGDPFAPSSARESHVIDMLAWWLARSTDKPIEAGRSPDMVIRNARGIGLDPYSIVGIGEIVIDPAVALQSFRNDLIFDSADPGDDEIFAIVQEPAADGCLAEAYAMGLSRCKVRFVQSNHQYAAPEADNYENLVSRRNAGPARVMWKQPGTGILWAVVLLLFPAASPALLGASGDGSLVFGALTLSGTTSHSGSIFLGTGALLTFGPLALSGTGHRWNNGAGTLTFGALALAGTGRSGTIFTGTGALAFGSLALAGTGRSGTIFTASPALTFGALAAAGIGHAWSKGSGALAFGSLALAGVGGHSPRHASGALVFGALSIAGNGKSGTIFTGSGALTFGSLAMAGTGANLTTNVHGTSALAFGALALAGTGAASGPAPSCPTPAENDGTHCANSSDLALGQECTYDLASFKNNSFHISGLNSGTTYKVTVTINSGSSYVVALFGSCSGDAYGDQIGYLSGTPLCLSFTGRTHVYVDVGNSSKGSSMNYTITSSTGTC